MIHITMIWSSNHDVLSSSCGPLSSLSILSLHEQYCLPLMVTLNKPFTAAATLRAWKNLWASWIEVDHIANHPMFSTIFSHIHHLTHYDKLTLHGLLNLQLQCWKCLRQQRFLCAKEQNFVLNFLSWFRSKKLNFLHNVHEVCGVGLAGTGQVRKFGNLDVDILLHF